MLNAISFLFEREEIPAEVIRNVMLYSLDCYSEKGMSGESGTSRTAMMFLTSWLNGFGKIGRLDISGEYLSGADVTMKHDGRLVHALKTGGVIVLRVMLDVWHYILVTGIADRSELCGCPYQAAGEQGRDLSGAVSPEKDQRDGEPFREDQIRAAEWYAARQENCFQIFDPWYDQEEFLCPGMKIAGGHPMAYNRIVAECCFDREKGLYSVGEESEREAVILYNRKTQLTEEKTIEYFI